MTLSPVWILSGLFVITFVDSIVIPLGPEFFAIVCYMYDRTPQWAIAILFIVCSAQILGTSILYCVGKFFPRWVKKLMRKYNDILFIKGEKIILLNCFVPLLPFLGAFIKICKWNLRISLMLVLVGGLIKYSIFIGLCDIFYNLFSEGIAQIVTILTVICVIGISIILSIRIRMRKYKLFNIKDIFK